MRDAGMSKRGDAGIREKSEKRIKKIKRMKGMKERKK